MSFDATLSFNELGKPMEVFLQPSAKSGSAIDAISRDLAIAISLGLQHGMQIEELRHAVTRADDGSAAGPLGRLLDMLEAQ